jgi:Tetratricopeptide repeat.
MKRILIALAIFASVQVADAQNTAAAKKAVEAAEAAAQNVKKATKVATWMNLANKYLDAYNAPAGNAMVGMDKTSLQLAMSNEKPSSTESVVVNGQQYTKEVYSDKNLYINAAGVLEILEVTKPVVADPLQKALDAFKKAAEVDVKNAKSKDIAAGISSIAEKYTNDAYSAYGLGDIKAANALFESAYKAAGTAPLSKVDTSALYNTAFTSWSLGDNAKAKELFEKCISYGYYAENGEVYAKLADVMGKLDSSEAGQEAQKSVLEEGFTKFPSSQSLLIGLINYYISTGKNTDRLFELLDNAKKNEPNNASLYYVEGNIHSQLGEIDEAVASYQKCSQISPEYEYGYIGEGILYYNQAIALQEKAQNEIDDNKYMAIVQEFETVLKKCIAPFEKAFELSKDESVKQNVAEYLKNAFYRFRDQDASFQAGYEKYEDYLNK